MNKYTLKNTKDYSLFSVSDHNRCVCPAHLRKLKPSMQEYGWIPSFPMLVHRTDKGLEIVDGQHRFFVAKDLGLAVWFVECDNGFDVAKINRPQDPWKTKDYADSFSRRGVSDYGEVLDFARDFRIPVSDAASILAGTCAFSNVREAWISGDYKIKDREHAGRVAYLYASLRSIRKEASDKSTRAALIAVARVPELDYERLIRNAKAKPELLIKYATREAALTMLEEVYNFRKGGPKFPLKVAAENAMSERNPARKRK